MRSRIDYVRGLLFHGGKLTCTVNTNPTTEIEKIKMVINPAIRVEPSLQICAASLLNYVECAISTFCVADRGHRHSSGISEVIFYISRGSRTQASSSEAGANSLGRVGLPAAQDLPVAGAEPVSADIEHHVASEARPVDIRLLIGSWQAMPSMLMVSVHSKFEAFRARNGPILTRTARRNWERQRDLLPAGSKVVVLYGLGNHYLGQKEGRILRSGFGRFADMYRLQMRYEEEWMEMWRCSPRSSPGPLALTSAVLLALTPASASR